VERHLNFQLFALFLTLNKKNFATNYFPMLCLFLVEPLSVSHCFFYRVKK
jgi:hypothetical protein